MTLDLGIIRRQRYVSTLTAANVTSSPYAQGGTITSYTYSGTTYIAHIFTASGIFTATSNIYPLEFLAVAGGGGGGNNAGTNAGGGGGGGGIISGFALTTINRVYPSPAYLAVTTSTQANVVGGWNPTYSDFSGNGSSFGFKWDNIQQAGGGARSSVIPEFNPGNLYTNQLYYMEIGITAIEVNTVAIGLIRDGSPKDGYANIPYVNLSNGTTGNWIGSVQTALGAFVAGDTIQLVWDSSRGAGQRTYWWIGKNNTYYSTPLTDVTNVALSTSTYQADGLRVIFMSAASGGGSIRGAFRSGSENLYAPPTSTGYSINTISTYSGYYTNPLGYNYISSGTTFGVTIGAGGGVNTVGQTAQVGAPGSNGGDTVIYNTTNPSYYYSTYFSNSYITATNAAFSFGTGDFTIETWLYPTSSYGLQTTTYSYRPIFNSRNFSNPDTAERGFIVYLDWLNRVTIYTSGTTYINTLNGVSNAVWSHIAVARSNGVLNVWVNGVKDKISFITTASSNTYANFTNTNIMIGYGSQNIDLTQRMFFTGYFNNYRIVKGLSVYNPGVTGVTAPLTATKNANVNGAPSTAISGTSTSLLLLTTSSGGILFDSSLGLTATYIQNINTVVSVGGGPGTYSGSLSFNGTNQYLTSATSTAFTFGTGDFTVEYWVYYNAITAGTTYFICGSGRSSAGYIFGSFGFIPYMSTVSVGYQATPGATFKLQQWTHVAWVRNTSVSPGVNVYLNGSWSGYLAPSPGPTADNITEVGFTVGARSEPAYYVNAYISNLRVVKGVAIYTSTGTFTPPTTFTSATQTTSTDFTINAITTQTVLLTFNTATISDLSTLSNVLTQTSGTVSISTFAPFNTSTVIFRAFGGGGGGSPYLNNGQIGGSGGGAPGGGSGGAAIPGQGNRGGQGSQSLASGGGGFAYPGGPAVNEGTWPISINGQYPAGQGGAGGYFNHSGAMVAYSGGGGGGSWNSTLYGVGLGGVGGGGNGGYYTLSSALVSAVPGTVNSGGGGGGSNVNFSNAAAGGSGIVIFRYPAFIGDAARFPTDLTDSNLKNTTLLLSGQLTTVTNNRTFIDSSVNNITINTASVTIAQGTFSPYGSLWSTAFNGTTDYTSFASTITTSTVFQQNIFWGTNRTFTIEAWLNPNYIQLSNTATVILGDVQPNGPGVAWSVGLDSSNKPMMYWRDAINGNNFITATNTLSTGSWNHVAWVSNAGTATIFINGASQFSTTGTTFSTLTNTTQTYGIVSGAYFNKFYNGSISNLKVSTSALYSPSTATSVYFNGSSYLSSATSTAFIFGTNNFTVEFWVYWTAVAGYNHIAGGFTTANGVAFGALSGQWYMTTSVAGFNSGLAFTLNQWYHVAWVRNSGQVVLYLNGTLSYSVAFTTNITETGFTLGGTATAGQYSTAYVSNLRVLNGAALYTSNFTVPATNLPNITNTTLLTFLTTSTAFRNYSSSPYILATSAGTPSFVRNVPVPVATFIPPAAPFNASANTVLLTHNTYKHGDSSTSSFAISTGTATSTPKIQKYSPYSMGYTYTPLTIGGSVFFNGTSDYLYTTTATFVPSLQLSSDFTIECWVYTTSTALAQCIFDTVGNFGDSTRPNAFALNIAATTGLLSFSYSNTTSPLSISPVVPYTWNHIAVTRTASYMSVWQNGNVILTVNSSTNFSTGQMVIGRNGPTATSYFTGYISDFRVIKGQSIYNSPFNSPVAPLKTIDTSTNTSLLLNFTNIAIADYSMQNNVVTINTATVSSTVTNYNPRSIYLSGISDYLTIVPFSTASSALGVSDFTIEMWINVAPQIQPGQLAATLQASTVRSIFDMRTTNTANAGFDIYLGNTGTLNVSTLGIGYITGTTFISVNTWNHIALVRRLSNLNLYLNGIPEGIPYYNTATNFINPTVRIGFGAAGTGYFSGYIDDLRITRGVARYTSAFLVPQKALPVK